MVDIYGNIEGYNGLPDNLIKEGDDLGVQRAKIAAQMSWLSDKQAIKPSVNATPQVGDIIKVPNTPDITSDDLKPGTLRIEGIDNNGLIVGYDNANNPITVPNDDNVKVETKGVEDTGNEDENPNGNGDTPSALPITSTPVDEKQDSNIEEINRRKVYTPPPMDKIPCYVVNNLTGTVIEFYVSPEELSDSMSAQYDDVATKNRTSPIKGYNNSGPRDISFSIMLHNDYCRDGILHTVRQLQALTLPTKSSGFVKAPSCKVCIGKMINITGICTSVNVSWRKPYHNDVYSMAEISLSFNEVQDTSVFAEQWEKKGD